jgi:hypothetical protein
MSRLCSKCKEMKDDFPHKKTYCRQCGNEMCRDYKRRNKEKIAAYNKIYKEEHKEEVSVYNHNYNLENREAIQERQTRTQRERKKNDAKFNISKKYRSKVQKDVKKKFDIDDNISKELYSCESNLIKEWFKSLFTDEMTWDNHGEVWHIDHIKPCASYDVTKEEELKACFHWSNLRPVKVIENQRKTNKIDSELIEEYKTKANNFLEYYENL